MSNLKVRALSGLSKISESLSERLNSIIVSSTRNPEYDEVKILYFKYYKKYKIYRIICLDNVSKSSFNVSIDGTYDTLEDLSKAVQRELRFVTEPNQDNPTVKVVTPEFINMLSSNSAYVTNTGIGTSLNDYRSGSSVICDKVFFIMYHYDVLMHVNLVTPRLPYSLYNPFREKDYLNSEDNLPYSKISSFLHDNNYTLVLEPNHIVGKEDLLKYNESFNIYTSEMEEFMLDLIAFGNSVGSKWGVCGEKGFALLS